MVDYSIAEVVQFAIRIEQNGRRFYQSLARHFADYRVICDFFSALADQEGDHKAFFERLATDLEQEETAWPLSEDYFLYLRGFADKAVFNDEATDVAIKNVQDMDQALVFAIERERHSIDYYTGLKKAIPEGEHADIDRIIAEEKRHLRQLEDQRKRMTQL